ncbi:MAG TPA: LysE family translocator [Mizugakiibacter sp.]
MDLGIEHYGVFLLAGIALNLAPGPDTFYILARSGAEGRAAGVASALGIAAGSVVHTTAAALGLSALLATSLLAFEIVKYAGAAYLVFLGVRMLRAKAQGAPGAGVATRGRGASAAFRQGMLTNVLNPKVALFFLAFLPQFIAPAAAHAKLGFAVLGLSFVGTGLAWCLVLALAGAGLGAWLRTRPRFGAWMDRVCGAAFVALGVRLALQQRG